APAGIAPDVAAKLESAALTAIKSAKIQQHMRDGELRGTLDAAGFKARIARDIAFWGPMIKQLGISMTGGEAAPPKGTGRPRCALAVPRHRAGGLRRPPSPLRRCGSAARPPGRRRLPRIFRPSRSASSCRSRRADRSTWWRG